MQPPKAPFIPAPFATLSLSNQIARIYFKLVDLEKRCAVIENAVTQESDTEEYSEGEDLDEGSSDEEVMSEGDLPPRKRRSAAGLFEPDASPSGLQK